MSSAPYPAPPPAALPSHRTQLTHPPPRGADGDVPKGDEGLMQSSTAMVAPGAGKRRGTLPSLWGMGPCGQGVAQLVGDTLLPRPHSHATGPEAAQRVPPHSLCPT